VLEAGFLILLAVVVGIADLSPALIALVMAIAWLLVAMIEYSAWRQSPGFSAATRYEAAVGERAPAPAAVHEDVVEEVAPPPPPAPTPEPPPPEEETLVAPPSAEPEEPAAFLPEPKRLVRYRLEPLQPRPRRRWIVFGPRERPEAPAQGSREEER